MPARFMSQYGLFPFIIMMDIAVQKGISLAFPYRCIITVCLPAIPTWGTSSQRIRTAKTYVRLLWVYLSEMYEKVFKNKNVVLLPIAAPSCHLFLGINKVKARLLGVPRYALWSRGGLTHRHNKGRIFTRVFGTWCRLLHISEALLR